MAEEPTTAPPPAPAPAEDPVHVGLLTEHTHIDDCKIHVESGIIPTKGLPEKLIRRMEEIRETKKTWLRNADPFPPQVEANLAQLDLECLALNDEFFAQREESAKKSQATFAKADELIKALVELLPKKKEGEEGEEADAEEAEPEPEPEPDEEVPSESADGADGEGAPPPRPKVKELTPEQKELYGRQLAEAERVMGEMETLVRKEMLPLVDDWIDKQKIFVDVVSEALFQFVPIAAAYPPNKGTTVTSATLSAVQERMRMLRYLSAMVDDTIAPEPMRLAHDPIDMKNALRADEFARAFLHTHLGAYLLPLDIYHTEDALKPILGDIHTAVAEAKETLAKLRYGALVGRFRDLLDVCQRCMFIPSLLPPPEEPEPVAEEEGAEGTADGEEPVGEGEESAAQ